jgi:cystathionine beta-lyase
MGYNFDEIVDRHNTDSIKYDLRRVIFGKEDVLPMWVADMDFKTPDFIIDAIRRRLDHEVLGYAMKPATLDDAIINWMFRRHGWNIRKEWIILSPGVMPSMAVLVYAFSDPGDEIIVQQPVYFPFFRTITNNGRKLVNNPLVLKNDKYEIDLQDLKRKITPRTKMIFFCSPHNPGGRVWRKDDLEELASLCLEKGIIIVSDEIHSDLVLFGNKHIPTATLGDEVARQTITCMSPSKTFNTAGLNTSFVIISDLKKRRSYKDKLNDFHLNLSNISGLTGLEAAYRDGDEWLSQMLKYVEENILFLEAFIRKNIPSIKVMRPEGTYLVWLDFRVTKIDITKLKDFLIHDAGLGLSDGTLFGEEGTGFQRINVACPRSVLKGGLEGLYLAFDKS